MLTIVEVIRYKTFKERLQLVKEYTGRAYIEVCNGYLYIERVEEEV